jgi:hypothetical protein
MHSLQEASARRAGVLALRHWLRGPLTRPPEERKKREACRLVLVERGAHPAPVLPAVQDVACLSRLADAVAGECVSNIGGWYAYQRSLLWAACYAIVGRRLSLENASRIVCMP